MQSADLQLIYEGYWNGYYVALAVGIFLAALYPFAQEWRQKNDRLRMPSDPLLTLSLAGMVFAVAYPIAGLLGKLCLSPHPLYFYILASGVGILILFLRIVGLKGARKQIALITTELSQFQTGTDIKDIFTNPQDPLFIKSLSNDLRQSKFINITSVGHNILEEDTALRKALLNFVAAGGEINVVSDTSQHNALNIDSYRRVPEVFSRLMRGLFVIDCEGPIYFGIGVNFGELPIARFDGRGSGRQSTSLGVHLLTNQLSRQLGSDHAVTVRAATSPAEYKELILPLESAALTIDRIPKRLFVVFKSVSVIQSIAEQRYGIGSVHIKHYIEEHAERSRKFYLALGRGMVCREIYNKSEIINYVSERKHGESVSLSAAQIRETVIRWRDAIRHQENYVVCLTDNRLPFKYELINGVNFIMHEAIGQRDDGRMNAFCITGKDFCEKPMTDFEIIWNNVSPQSRKQENVVQWIEDEILPLCEP